MQGAGYRVLNLVPCTLYLETMKKLLLFTIYYLLLTTYSFSATPVINLENYLDKVKLEQDKLYKVNTQVNYTTSIVVPDSIMLISVGNSKDFKVEYAGKIVLVKPTLQDIETNLSITLVNNKTINFLISSKKTDKMNLSVEVYDETEIQKQQKEHQQTVKYISDSLSIISNIETLQKAYVMFQNSLIASDLYYITSGPVKKLSNEVKLYIDFVLSNPQRTFILLHYTPYNKLIDSELEIKRISYQIGKKINHSYIPAQIEQIRTENYILLSTATFLNKTENAKLIINVDFFDKQLKFEQGIKRLNP